MKRKTAYAAFTLTESGKDYMVKGNFGADKAAATGWMEKSVDEEKYPRGLFVKKVKY